MKLIDFLCRKIGSYVSAPEKSDGQDLVLYRQLRRSENKLFDVRDNLDRLLDRQRESVVGSARLSRVPDKSQKEIDRLKREIQHLETEYQGVQKKVRTYFYFDACQVRLPEVETAAGQAP